LQQDTSDNEDDNYETVPRVTRQESPFPRTSVAEITCSETHASNSHCDVPWIDRNDPSSIKCLLPFKNPTKSARYATSHEKSFFSKRNKQVFMRWLQENVVTSCGSYHIPGIGPNLSLNPESLVSSSPICLSMPSSVVARYSQQRSLVRLCE
jgi:hypothetical protein